MLACFNRTSFVFVASLVDASKPVQRVGPADDRARRARDEARHSALAWRTVAWATATAKNAALNAKLKQIAVDERRAHVRRV
jgi:hypothetical protein